MRAGGWSGCATVQAPRAKAGGQVGCRAEACMMARVGSGVEQVCVGSQAEHGEQLGGGTRLDLLNSCLWKRSLEDGEKQLHTEPIRD